MNMGDLIALLFLSREQAHRAHFKAQGNGSYAAHVALNDFYDAIIDNADTITEKYQGEFGVLIDIPFLEPSDASVADVYGTILAELKAHKGWIDQHRYEVCPKEKTAIQNLIDESLELYQEVIYKLSFLK
jgi:hypothetical protein